MSHNMPAMRHTRHEVNEIAVNHVTDVVTRDTSIRHPSPYVSPEKPLDHADRDTCDALTRKPDETRRTKSNKSHRFNGLKARDYFFNDGAESRNVIQLMMGAQHLGFIEYDTARKFVDKIHDLCDEHETRQRQGGNRENP